MWRGHHYGGAVGPVIFGVIMIMHLTWWIVGGILALLTLFCISPLGYGGGIINVLESDLT